MTAGALRIPEAGTPRPHWWRDGRALRRLRIYSGRALAVAGGGLRRPCLFMHLPKCGGTSLSEALYATVPLDRKVAVIDAVSSRRAAALAAFGADDPARCHEDLPDGHLTFAFREQVMLMHMAAGAALIHGHVLWSDIAARQFGAHYATVTMMRAPVDRAISNFRMMARAGFVGPDVDAWLDGPVGRSHATVALRYLSGRNVVPEGEEPAAMELARARLDRCALVGFLDDLPGFLDGFADIFGVRPKVGAHNRATGPELSLSAGQRRRLEAACAWDAELHDLARRRFGRGAA